METNNNNQKCISIAHIIRLISLILIIIFFIPTFVVSCSGQDVNISAKTAMMGYSFRGENVIESHPICILFLLIPVAVLIIWCVKDKIIAKMTALWTVICTIVDFIIWIILKDTVKKTAFENACSFKTTGWFSINLILLILLFILSISIYLNYIKAETNVFDLIAYIKPNNKTSKQVNNYAPKQETTCGYCENCGNPILEGNLFCTKCGNKVE